MKIILISGLSGSGKSVALKLLEDTGYYCIDNLPLSMLPDLIRCHAGGIGTDKLGVGIDMRSRINIEAVREQAEALRREGHEIRLLFLEAAEEVLLRRFSETRRSHPLAGSTASLAESLNTERIRLAPLREAAYCIDTSKTNSQQLRHAVRQWLDISIQGLTVVIETFGFKYGVPADIDFLFDVRCLPNPYYDEALRPFTGLDPAVIRFLEQQPAAEKMQQDIVRFLHDWLPEMQKESRSYVTVGIGCTGGRHRSVYIGSRVAESLRTGYTVLIRNRQIDGKE